jgi:hypothetical protein
VNRLNDFPYPASIPEGRFANYGIVLATKPLGDVSVSLSTSDMLTIAPSEFTFTPENWDVPQTFRVVAIEGPSVRANPVRAFINFAFDSAADGNYSQVTHAPTEILVEDTSVGMSTRCSCPHYFLLSLSHLFASHFNH